MRLHSSLLSSVLLLLAIGCKGSSAPATGGSAAAGSAHVPAGPGRIEVVAGTYGENCHAAHGNVTAALAAACDGKTSCDYKVDYHVIGDPAPGCSKRYLAEWRCGGDAHDRQVEVAAEAGYGGVAHLTCD
jgi:hypothetical protein